MLKSLLKYVCMSMERNLIINKSKEDVWISILSIIYDIFNLITDL